MGTYGLRKNPKNINIFGQRTGGRMDNPPRKSKQKFVKRLAQTAQRALN
jgi:hypothetical protein